jgi:hypothetical protein
VALDALKALRGAQQTEADPSPPHVAIAPALRRLMFRVTCRGWRGV